MSSVKSFSAIARHVFTEPRFVAEVEWLSQSNSVSRQLEAQVGREATEQFVAGGGWPDPDQEITIVMPDEPPDWDWWEPTTRWRRIAARDRAAGI